jgi:hypothetical protein
MIVDFQNIDPARTALLISSIALLASLVSLGWNIRKDFGLRPGVKVSLSVVAMIIAPEQIERRIAFRAVNLGPGGVHLTSLVLKGTWRNRKAGGYKWAGVMPSPPNGFGQSLPQSLVVGKEAVIMVPYDSTCFLAVKHAKAGIVDSFGRMHWALTEQLRRAEGAAQRTSGDRVLLRREDQRDPELALSA